MLLTCLHNCVSGAEEDDPEISAVSYDQHAKPLPLSMCESSVGMDGLPVQHAVLH